MAKAKKMAAKKVSKSSTAAPKTPATETQVEGPTPAQEGTQLTIADLQALASVIDVAVRRGAFGAGEVTEVGAIFDKLSSFLKVIAEQKAAADKAAGVSMTEGEAE